MKNLIEVALGEYMTAEVSGAGNNPRILEYFKESGRPEWQQDSIPWCAMFLDWCLVQLGLPLGSKGLASDFLTYGTPVDVPQMGDIVVFSHTNLTHVTIFIRELNGTVYCLGGNQSDEVNIMGFDKNLVSAYRRIPSTTPITPPTATFTALLKLGSTGDEVKQLQAFLNAQNGSQLVVDGIFGKDTFREVAVFQMKHNLTADGVVGTKTNAVLNSLF